MNVYSILSLVNLLLFQRVVAQKLFDQVDVGQHHPPAAVPLQLELVQRVPFQHQLVLEVLEVRLPLVPDDLTAREASDGDNHLVAAMGCNWRDFAHSSQRVVVATSDDETKTGL